MPGRSGGQLVLLQQHRIRPPGLRQMIERRDAHRPAADDDHPRLPRKIRHVPPPQILPQYPPARPAFNSATPRLLIGKPDQAASMTRTSRHLPRPDRDAQLPPHGRTARPDAVHRLRPRAGARNRARRTLFTRSRAGTQLTTEGLKFEPHARPLRHAMAEARRAVSPTGTAAVTLRIGIQNDLAARPYRRLGVGLPPRPAQTAFYIEPDYSAQMCADLGTGRLDFAVLYSPRALPDLHFTSVGDVTYRLISSDDPSARHSHPNATSAPTTPPPSRRRTRRSCPTSPRPPSPQARTPPSRAFSPPSAAPPSCLTTRQRRSPRTASARSPT